MDKVLLTGLVLVFTEFPVEGAKEVLCDKIGIMRTEWTDEYKPQCEIVYPTSIITSDVVIKSDYPAIAMCAFGDEFMKFLPNEMGKVFPALELLSITYCKVQWIGPKNFIGMKKVTAIDLRYNKIDDIPKDTFKSVDSLTSINLCEYSINVQK